VIATFKSLTGENDTQRAIRYLIGNNWYLQQAVNMYRPASTGTSTTSTTTTAAM
jgi:hypothetical protein